MLRKIANRFLHEENGAAQEILGLMIALTIMFGCFFYSLIYLHATGQYVFIYDSARETARAGATQLNDDNSLNPEKAITEGKDILTQGKLKNAGQAQITVTEDTYQGVPVIKATVVYPYTNQFKNAFAFFGIKNSDSWKMQSTAIFKKEPKATK